MLICSRKLFLLIIVIVSLKNPAFCQLVLNSPNSSGYHIAPTTITLSPGFSTAPGQIFSAKIISTPTIQLSNQNYVLETIVKQSGITISDDLPYQDHNVAIRSVQYFDGLGRPMQNISINGNNNGTKDLILPIGYDGFGREANKYLAYATQGNFGSYRADALNPSSGVFAFYTAPSQNIAATAYPYASTKFENNPFEKVIEQGAVGASWQPDPNNSTGHTLKNTYLTNTDQNGSRPVKHYMAKFGYTYNGNPINQYDLAEIGFYNKNELSVVINYSENWVASDAQAGTTEEYKDRLGNVILKRQYNKKPNNSIETLSTYYVYDGYGHLTFVLPPGTMPDNGNISTANLNDFAYQYRYDGKERLIEKKVPGKGWEYMVYNKRDQVTYHKDSKQAANAEWSWNKYDGLGRVIATGIETGKAADRQTIQNLFDAHSGQNFESRTSATVEGYTIDTYPMASDSNPNIDYYTINYYDDYDFPGNSAIYAPTLIPSAKTKGLPTAIKTRILGTTTFLLTVMYYDDEGRIIETIADNYLQGTDRIVNVYDFAGQLLNSTRSHIANGVTTLIAERSEYDHMGRKIRNYQKIGDATSTEVLLSESSYNDIGQLVSKKLHNGLKENTYTYNERGWLKTSTTPSLFAMELKYQDGLVPQYNGNISAQNWSTDAGAQKSYAYSYDNLSRLLSGISSQGKNEILTYDIMGNISSLIRDSGTPQAYYYLGNRLQSVTGGASRNFTYDENGSVVTDGTNTFTYNYLSLPQTVTGPNAAVYTYDASGRKLSRTAGGVTTYYVDGIQYTGTVIDFIQTEEGIARRNTATQYLYQYNLTDHLGNVRYTFDGTGGKLQADDYYPFGKTYNSFVSGAKNTYLYNGKDLQEGLGQYDYGARFYDPEIGRWNVVDPLAEKDRKTTPYAYVFNNPMIFTDPDGMFGDYYGKDGSYIGNDGKDDDKAYVAGKDAIIKSSTSNGVTTTLLNHSKVTELSVSNTELMQLASTSYGESGTSNIKAEVFGIASAIMNNKGERGDNATISSTIKGFAFAATDGNSRTGQFNDASKVGRNGTFMQTAIAGAINAVTGGLDISNGATHWAGSDIGSNAEKRATGGLLFTNPDHDMQGLGSKTARGAPVTTYYYNKSGKATGVRDTYSYTWETTGSQGGTTFMKKTNSFIKATGAPRY